MLERNHVLAIALFKTKNRPCFKKPTFINAVQAACLRKNRHESSFAKNIVARARDDRGAHDDAEHFR